MSDLTKVTSKDLYLSLLAPSSSKANYYLAQIVELGAAAILNMLKSSFSGAVIKDVTAENFAAQAVAFLIIQVSVMSERRR